LEKKSRTITGNFTHKRYDRLETKGYIKRSSQSPSMQNMLCWWRRRLNKNKNSIVGANPVCA
jgi:hypothetical protein